MFAYTTRMLLAGSLVAFLTASAGAAQDKPVADPDPARYDKAIAAFERWDRKNTPAKDAVLFVGSSSIRMWNTRDSFPTLPVINRGFGGSHISDVNHFFDRIVMPYKPPVIVFYCGDNDIAAGKSPERVARDYREFAKRVHKKFPKTRIIYQPIKPSTSRWKHWPNMQKANDLIRTFIQGDERLSYVDTATPMLGPNGKPNADLLLDDGLHLNEQGYAIWTRFIQPAIEELRAMKQTSHPC